MDVDKIAAGSELDALVAEKVMGWVLSKDGSWWEDSRLKPKATFATQVLVGMEAGDLIWRPSAEIATAWKVAEKTQILSLPRHLYFDRGSKLWKVVYPEREGFDEVVGQGETAPLAICRAALRTVLDSTKK